MTRHTPLVQAVSRHPILVAVGVCGVTQVVFPGAISRLLPEKLRSALLDSPFLKKLRPVAIALVDFAPRLRSILRIKGQKVDPEAVAGEDTRGAVPIEKHEEDGGKSEEEMAVVEAPVAQEQVEEGGGVPIDGGEGHHEHHEHHENHGHHEHHEHHEHQHHEHHHEHHG